MSFSEYFAPRLRLLRTAHSLSLKATATLLGKKTAAISNMESGKVGTTLQGLEDICSLFAVSADWLLGLSNNPYNEDFLCSLEDKIIQCLYSYIEAGKSLPKEQRTDEQAMQQLLSLFALQVAFILENDRYTKPGKRKKCYTLSTRADIIFAFNLLHILKRNSYITNPNRADLNPPLRLPVEDSQLPGLHEVYCYHFLKCQMLPGEQFPLYSNKQLFFDITKAPAE